MTKAYAALNNKDKLVPHQIERRNVGPHDVQIEIDYCGVCHSDIHMARNDWGQSVYPIVPGHEIIGHITKCGEKVTDFHVGERVGVGCMVDSCQECSACDDNLEQYCENGMTMTYSSPDSIMGGTTHGGYSQNIVVDDKFVLHVSDKLDIKGAAPLLCAGITTYSPLKHWNVKKGDKVGVVGLGGLGHMAIKIAAAMGAYVVMITTSPNKAQDAKKLGADEVLISTDKKAMDDQANSFDFIIDTIPVAHEVNPYILLLKRDSTIAVIGSTPLNNVHSGDLVFGRKRMVGSLIGGIKETQEMLDFCAEHNIVSDVEVIPMEDINKAYERMIKSDVKYRFVIDMKSLA